MKAQAAKQAVVGILAHVDAGKTTLLDALLYRTGTVRKLGSVNDKDSYLDFHALERQRGITIYAKQATIQRYGVELALLDTPGHVDFAAETERVLKVLDYAVLVINGSDGVQGHTLTLWQMLQRYKVPTVVFANKMDFARKSPTEMLDGFCRQLSQNCIDFTSLTVRTAEDDQLDVELSPETVELCAATDEDALDEYVETETLRFDTLRRLFWQRAVFPCFFGSALRQDGIDELMDGIAVLARQRTLPSDFGSRVFKISHDTTGTRLTWMKITGGELSARQLLEGQDDRGPWAEKVDQIRVYSGSKYETRTHLSAGRICAVTGLTRAQSGTTLGTTASPGNPEPDSLIAPAFANSVHAVGADVTQLHNALNTLTDEDPQLNVRWNEQAQELQVQLMGAIQLEILEATLHDRFGLDVEFGPSSVLYRETITEPVIGIGHFEPLRHYAEVHVLLEPLPRGSGVEFGTRCHVDTLDLNWQRLILTNAMEREHAGVLIGAPITDMRITLIAGQAHDKHTVGGDFRQATYRAIRQGLMQAQSMLLEPWNSFWLRAPSECVGRAMSDLQRMGAHMQPPRAEGDFTLLSGEVPAKEAAGYATALASYTHGLGSISLRSIGYETCHDADAIIEEAAYDPEADLANTPDSVFCSHGAGHAVKWGDVPAFAHCTANPAAFTEWREANAAFFAKS